MKKLIEVNGEDYEISVNLNSTSRFHHIIVAGKGHHEEILCSTYDLENVIPKMELDVRSKFSGQSVVEILKDLGFN